MADKEHLNIAIREVDAANAWPFFTYNCLDPRFMDQPHPLLIQIRQRLHAVDPKADYAKVIQALQEIALKCL
jgi:hypothetical protein